MPEKPNANVFLASRGQFRRPNARLRLICFGNAMPRRYADSGPARSKKHLRL